MNDTNEVRTTFADETLTVGSTVGQLSEAVFAPSCAQPADLAVLTVKVDAISWRDVGLDPTASLGHLQASGSHFVVYGTQNIRKLRLIRVTNDATVHITYSRRGDS